MLYYKFFQVIILYAVGANILVDRGPPSVVFLNHFVFQVAHTIINPVNSLVEK